MRTLKNVAGIILAAGDASRFGAVKQLMPWKGSNLINSCLRNALQAELGLVVVVLGSHHEEIQVQLPAGDYRIAINLEWQSGQSSSLKVGLAVLPNEIEGALFLLADQPQITPEYIREVALKGMTENCIVIPQVLGQRANPIYFPRASFSRLMTIEGDRGGRAVIADFPSLPLEWDDPWMAKDIDTVEDYQSLVEHYQADFL